MSQGKVFARYKKDIFPPKDFTSRLVNQHFPIYKHESWLPWADFFQFTDWLQSLPILHMRPAPFE